MIGLATLATLATLSAAAAGAQATTDTREHAPGVFAVARTSYYELRGRTVAALAADMRLRGPKDADGRTFTGFTESPVRWEYAMRAVGATCTATGVRVTVSTDVLLPRWVPPADTEPGLAEKWYRSKAALALHESGHSEIAIRHATVVRDSIAAKRVACSRFVAEVNAMGNRLVEVMRGVQAKYDADTRHGLAQGTGFPPPALPDSLPLWSP